MKNTIDHIKRYALLGAIAIMPIALAIFLFDYLYSNVNNQVGKIFPSLGKISNLSIFIIAAISLLYFLGIALSYFFGKRVQKISQRWTEMIPDVKSLKDELNLAQKIHESIIPPSKSTNNVDVSVSYIPCRSLGGDFVTYHFYSEKEIMVVIADITGHGIAQALLVNRFHTEIERFIIEKRRPGALLRKADQFVKRAFQGTNMYISAFCAFLDLEMMTMAYSNYGHLPQYLYCNQDKQIKELASQTTLLGVGETTRKIFQEQITINHHDRLMLFTDGIPETQGWKGKRYGYERLKKEFTVGMAEPLPKFQESFLKKLWHFTEEEYEDDVCLMCVDVK